MATKNQAQGAAQSGKIKHFDNLRDILRNARH